jgi:isoquinoline 1-oxidoreductase beta subunit
MSTGASRSIGMSQNDLRRPAPSPDAIAAAAAQWNVPGSEVPPPTHITHRPSGRTVTFGAVAAAAATTCRRRRSLKDPKDWKLIGTRQRRLEVADKVTGKRSTVSTSGCRICSTRPSSSVPVFAGKLGSVDETKLAGIRGIRPRHQAAGGRRRVADSWWHASKAADALRASWDVGDKAEVSSATICAALREA